MKGFEVTIGWEYSYEQSIKYPSTSRHFYRHQHFYWHWHLVDSISSQISLAVILLYCNIFTVDVGKCMVDSVECWMIFVKVWWKSFLVILYYLHLLFIFDSSLNNILEVWASTSMRSGFKIGRELMISTSTDFASWFHMQMRQHWYLLTSRLD